MNKKASRLAVLGELGNYPLFIKAIELTIKYEWHLNSMSRTDTLVHNALSEMHCMAKKNVDSWLTRTIKMKELLEL